jgi:predicted nucleotidyltransferase
MNPLIEANRTQLEQLCRRYSVRRLELFGSAARGESQPEASDLDFLVEFEPLPPGEHADAYFGLLFALEGLFHRNIDLVEIPAIRNPYFLRDVNQSRMPLYTA